MKKFTWVGKFLAFIVAYVLATVLFALPFLVVPFWVSDSGSLPDWYFWIALIASAITVYGWRKPGALWDLHRYLFRPRSRERHVPQFITDVSLS